MKSFSAALLAIALLPAAVSAELPGPPLADKSAPGPAILNADNSGGGSGSEKSLTELAVEMTNPFGSVFSVFNRLETTGFQGDLTGASDQNRLNLDVLVSFPFLLDSGRRIITRVNFPINLGEPTYSIPKRDYVEWGIRQDADILPDGRPWFDGHGHLSDISWDVSWGGASDRGWITGIGIAGVLPTGQDGSIERDQYLLGPDLTLGKVSDWGILGARLRHLVDVANVSNREDDITWSTNETQLEVFFNYPLNNRWSIISSPTLVYDWEGASGNQVLVPLGGGVSRMMRWFGVPVKMDIELEYYVVSPDFFGPEWLARFSLSPAILDRARR
jgi:hypothetical protein